MSGLELRWALGWTLLRFLWVGGGIWVAAAVARRLLRDSSPRARYAAALATMVSLATAPLAILVGLLPDAPVAVAVPEGVVATVHSTPADEVGGLEAVVPLLPFGWVLGSSLWLLAIATGLVGTRRLRGRSVRLDADHPIAARCGELARELRLSVRVAVATCDRVAGPVVVGLARPVILLPSALLAGLAPRELELVLLHELAHVRRWDNLAVLFQRMFEALLFFHPAVWWVSRWADLERESCCDAVVLGLRPDPRHYAVTLARLSDPTVPALSAGMARHDLPRRIARILGRKESTMNPASRVIAALAAGALALPLLVESAAAQSCGGGCCSCEPSAQRAPRAVRRHGAVARAPRARAWISTVAPGARHGGFLATRSTDSGERAWATPTIPGGHVAAHCPTCNEVFPQRARRGRLHANVPQVISEAPHAGRVHYSTWSGEAEAKQQVHQDIRVELMRRIPRTEHSSTLDVLLTPQTTETHPRVQLHEPTEGVRVYHTVDGIPTSLHTDADGRFAAPLVASGTVLDAEGNELQGAILTLVGEPRVRVVDGEGNVLRAATITVDGTEHGRALLDLQGSVELTVPQAIGELDETMPVTGTVIRSVAPVTRRTVIGVTAPAAEAKGGACPHCGHALGAAPDGSL